MNNSSDNLLRKIYVDGLSGRTFREDTFYWVIKDIEFLDEHGATVNGVFRIYGKIFGPVKFLKGLVYNLISVDFDFKLHILDGNIVSIDLPNKAIIIESLKKLELAIENGDIRQIDNTLYGEDCRKVKEEILDELRNITGKVEEEFKLVKASIVKTIQDLNKEGLEC